MNLSESSTPAPVATVCIPRAWLGNRMHPKWQVPPLWSSWSDRVSLPGGPPGSDDRSSGEWWRTKAQFLHSCSSHLNSQQFCVVTRLQEHPFRTSHTSLHPVACGMEWYVSEWFKQYILHYLHCYDLNTDTVQCVSYGWLGLLEPCIYFFNGEVSDGSSHSAAQIHNYWLQTFLLSGYHGLLWTASSSRAGAGHKRLQQSCQLLLRSFLEVCWEGVGITQLSICWLGLQTALMPRCAKPPLCLTLPACSWGGSRSRS